MGLVRKILNSISRHPELNGKIAAVATFLGQIPKLEEIMRDSYFQDGSMPATIAKMMIYCAPPALLAYIAVSFSSVGLHALTREKRALRLKDYKMIKELKAQLNQKIPPTIQFSGTQEVDCSLPDFVKSKYIKASTLEKNAREKKDYAGAMNTVFRYLGSAGSIDKGLILLRDAQEWIESRKPKLSVKTRAILPFFSFAIRGGRLLDPCKVETYMVSAANESIRQPEHAWYWSALGKSVADTLDTKRAEMYVFHALLATAQKRSDEEQAWTEAIKLLQETGQPERVGESRNPVWMLKNSEFFEQTFRFKGKKTREALEKEWKDYLKLEEILQGIATVPQPLYITKEPNNGLYTLAMRFLPGESLYDQLERGDKSNLQITIPVDARILARYPAEELPRISIAKKHYDKLTSKYLCLPEDLARNILAHLRPIETALENDKIWRVNADRHAQQTLISETIGELDAEFENKHPAINEAANKLEYIGEFTNEERKYYATKFAEALRQEGTSINDSELAHAYEDNLFGMYDNAAIHRLICLLTAMSDPERPKMHKHRKRLANNIVRAINDHKKDDKTYYEANREDYDELEKSFTKVSELIPS